jgi:hypothetical protein
MVDVLDLMTSKHRNGWGRVGGSYRRPASIELRKTSFCTGQNVLGIHERNRRRKVLQNDWRVSGTSLLSIYTPNDRALR